MKEKYLEEINQLEINNLMEIHNIQVQINKTKLRILEHDLNINLLIIINILIVT